MKILRSNVYVVLLLSLCLALSGCLNLDPQADPTRFYLLSASNEAGVSQDEEGLSIGFKRVDVPSYLKNRKIVVRLDSDEIRYSEIHRWGEDLETGISRTLATNLTAKNGVQQVSVVPWQDNSVHDVEIKVKILRFDGADDGNVILRALWEIQDPSTGNNLATGDTSVNRSGWNGRNYGRLASLMSDTLASMSRDLSEAISKLSLQSESE
jgi:hypothetical protein